MSASDFTQRLVRALGPDTVLTAGADIAPWLSDWRGLYKGQAQAVVRPRTTDEVAICLALCQEAGVPVVPRGGNTGLCGGATPDSGAANVVLSLDRMNAVRAIDTVANTMVAEAGAILGNLRRAAQEAGRLLPLSLAAEDSSQIGGNVATNAGGVNVVRYGMARELVLGLEAVLPNGEVFHGLRTLRKDNTGYDLKQLLIGSEGTLGVITAVALRLFPRTDVRSVVLAAVESPAQALQLFELLFEQCGARLQAFEYFSGDCLDLVLAHAEGVQEPFAQRYPGYVLVELADTADEAALNTLLENVIGTALERGLCLDAAVSASLAQLQALWKLREEISEAQRADGPHLKHDVSLPIERIPEFMESAEARVRALYPDIRPFIFGHFGDGNLHYNLSRPAGADRDWAAVHGAAVTDVVLDEVNRYGGSISAEHGIGQLKRDHFLHSKDPLELRLMREIKAVLDPAGIMNPGKLL
ncbi:putative FAD-linked oxidoreductase [Achromobacter veterisilvae]|uniref:Putative FAD-linked oxidoreductase n=1 Tax=Achromobacter veterisilvae TaxID=2069367 RepID=A0A446CBY8_9BURK|nr:FAD-binding oxidoreductase [Achromobacter veterisilvae]SSW65370.1 putative FAD-linked oxidoreductase [Achromobacter veterisilvae]